MAVVMLSSAALRKKVRMPTTQSRVTLVGAPDAVGDHLEALMGIHQFHHGHGAQQEEQDAGDVARGAPSIQGRGAAMPHRKERVAPA